MKKGLTNNPSYSIEDIYEFLLMLEGIPFSRILRCMECGDKWFISNRDGENDKRRYCSNRCASRYNKRDMRTNPARKEEYEEVKQKQRERYRKKVLG
jgi:hypothetical protein